MLSSRLRPSHSIPAPIGTRPVPPPPLSDQVAIPRFAILSGENFLNSTARVISSVGPSAYLGCYSAPNRCWCPFDPVARATITRDGLHRSPGPRSQAWTRSKASVREGCMSCKAQTDRCQELIHLPALSTGAELAVLILYGADVGRILLTPACSRRNVVDAAQEIATMMNQGTSISVTLVSTCVEIATPGHVSTVSSAVLTHRVICLPRATSLIGSGNFYMLQFSAWEGLEGALIGCLE